MFRGSSLSKFRFLFKLHTSYNTRLPTLRYYKPSYFSEIRFFSSSTDPVSQRTNPTSIQKSASVSIGHFERTIVNFKSMLSKLRLSANQKEAKAMITPLFSMVADTAENQENILQVHKLLIEFITLLKQANLTDLTPLIAAYRGLGVVYLNAKDCKAAQEHLEFAAEYCRKAIQAGDDKAKTQAVEIECLKLMVYDEQCEYKKAVNVFREIIGRLNELPNDEVPHNLAAAYCKFAERPQEEDSHEVAQLMEKGIEIIKEKFGQDNVELINCYRSIAVFPAAKNDFTKVSEYLEDCLRVCQKNYNGERLEVELAINDILRGNLYCASQENKDWLRNRCRRVPQTITGYGVSSLPHFKKGLSILEKSSEYPREILAEANLSLAMLYLYQFDDEESQAAAKEFFNKAVHIMKVEKGENSQELADIYLVWGELDLFRSYHMTEAIRIYMQEEEKNASKIYHAIDSMYCVHGSQHEELKFTLLNRFSDLFERTRDKPKRRVISAWESGTYFLSRRYSKFKIY